MAERRTVDANVAGSTPVSRPEVDFYSHWQHGGYSS